MMEWKRFRISKIIASGKDAKVFQLAPVEGGVPPRKPGQYITARLEGVERPYSLSGPVDAPYLEITLRLAGVFTHKMFEKREGGEMEAAAPEGRFILDEAKIGPGGLVFIAGGVGIAPIACIMDYMRARNLPNEATLLYASKRPDDILLKGRMDALASDKIRLVYSVDETCGLPWDGHVGFIDRQLIEASVQKPQEKKYFICGPPAMVQAIVGILKALGVPLQNVTIEGW